MIALVAVFLIFLHGPNGQEIEVNAHAISSVRPPRGREHFAIGTRCILIMNNRNLITVAEPCDEVIKMITKAKEP